MVNKYQLNGTKDLSWTETKTENDRSAELDQHDTSQGMMHASEIFEMNGFKAEDLTTKFMYHVLQKKKDQVLKNHASNKNRS